MWYGSLRVLSPFNNTWDSVQGRHGLSKAAMLERLQESLADIEQLKADLLSTVPPPKHTALPAAVVKKKRKAHSMAHAHGLGQDRQSKATPYSMLTLCSRDSQGENEYLFVAAVPVSASSHACMQPCLFSPFMIRLFAASCTLTSKAQVVYFDVEKLNCNFACWTQ